MTDEEAAPLVEVYLRLAGLALKADAAKLDDFAEDARTILDYIWHRLTPAEVAYLDNAGVP